MADYVLTCPRCEGAMYDQRAPTNQWPWKPGTPIAKCKDKECAKAGGVYWEDSKASPSKKAIAVPTAPPAARGPVMASAAVAPEAVATYGDLAIKHAQQLVELYASVAALIGERVRTTQDGFAKEVLASTDAEVIEKLAVAVYIEVQKRLGR